MSASVAGCGSSSPAAPTPPPPANVAGNWSGTFHAHYLSTSGATVAFTLEFAMSLTQNGNSVSGTWSAQDNPERTGKVGGNVTPTNFSGTFTYHRALADGRNCDGTFNVSGPAGGNSLNWTSTGVTENCTNAPTGITISAVRS